MKILMIVDNLKVGGMQRRFIELLKGLKTFPDVQCRVAILNDEIHYSQVAEIGYETIILKRKHKKDIKVGLTLVRLCRDYQPDIVHACGSMSAIYALLLKIFFKVKFINAMISNAYDKLPFNYCFRIKLTRPFSDRIVANSMAGLRAYKITGPKGQVIHNGVDIHRFNLGKNTGVLSETWQDNKCLIGMTGSFDNRKDFYTFISAARLLLQKRNDVEFYAIGDGPLLEKMKEEAGEFLQKGIYFPGKISEVETYILPFHIGVLTTYTEGISNSIIEFMALSKPVVATDGGGTNELIIDGTTGFLIEKGNVNSLVSKLQLLLDSPELLTSMGIEGRKRIENDFNLEKMTNSYHQLYLSVLEEM